MKTKQSLISNFRLFRQCLLLGFFLTPVTAVTAVGQAPYFEEMLEQAPDLEEMLEAADLAVLSTRLQHMPIDIQVLIGHTSRGAHSTKCP